MCVCVCVCGEHVYFICHVVLIGKPKLKLSLKNHNTTDVASSQNVPVSGKYTSLLPSSCSSPSSDCLYLTRTPRGLLEANSQLSLCACHVHVHTYTFIYIYLCVCVRLKRDNNNNNNTCSKHGRHHSDRETERRERAKSVGNC